MGPGTNPNLTNADLTGANLHDVNLTGANLTGANLTDANLTGASLIGVDLTDAFLKNTRLEWTDLSGVDLSGAYLDLPYEIPKVKDLVRLIPRDDSLDMRTWHRGCGTAHCLAGWAVVLANHGGQVLEAALGSNAAGALIWHVSTGEVPNFYIDDSEARTWLERISRRT